MPGLAMTRSMGDLQGKTCGIIAEPEVFAFSLKETLLEGKSVVPEYVVLASDGLWD